MAASLSGSWGKRREVEEKNTKKNAVHAEWQLL
jgi:hypothetical protein